MNESSWSERGKSSMKMRNRSGPKNESYATNRVNLLAVVERTLLIEVYTVHLSITWIASEPIYANIIKSNTLKFIQ